MKNRVGRLTQVLASKAVPFCERAGTSGIAENLIMPMGKRFLFPVACSRCGGAGLCMHLGNSLLLSQVLSSIICQYIVFMQVGFSSGFR